MNEHKIPEIRHSERLKMAALLKKIEQEQTKVKKSIANK
jgi:hypothetical protein